MCSLLSTPVAVSGSLGAGSLFGLSSRMMRKKLKLKGPAAIFRLSRLWQSVMNQSSVERQCVLPGAVLGTCTGVGDGLHGPALFLHKYD